MFRLGRLAGLPPSGAGLNLISLRSSQHESSVEWKRHLQANTADTKT